MIGQLKSASSNEDDSDILLIIDQPDLLLAATGASKGIGATEMMEWVMGLQQVGSTYLRTCKRAGPIANMTVP